MSWRTVVISKGAKLDYQMGYLVVRKDDLVKIHLKEIRMLLIESTAVSLTTALLAELVQHKIKVIFCDQKRLPCSELMPYYGSHDTSAKIREQIAWSKEDKSLIWTEIVTEKIRKQAELLAELDKPEHRLLEEYLTSVEIGDTTNREGHAAKVYFNALFGKDFSRSTENNINAALNYGYSILMSSFAREIVANGYMTQIGLFHDNMFNPFNLASDLMEPFRPIVDRKVLKMNLDYFESEQKMQLVDLLNCEVTINNRTEYVNNAIKLYCKSVFNALNDKDISLLQFYHYEL